MELSSSQKGGLAELKIAAEAADLGFQVYRPMIEGPAATSSSTCAARLLRIQCKWATRNGLVDRRPRCARAATPLARVRRDAPTARARSTGIAAYCRELDRCFFLPISEFAGRTYVAPPARPCAERPAARC